MMEIDAAVEVTGVDGPVPLIDLFQGRDVLVVYKHMWHDAIPTRGSAMAAPPRPGRSKGPPSTSTPAVSRSRC